MGSLYSLFKEFYFCLFIIQNTPNTPILLYYFRFEGSDTTDVYFYVRIDEKTNFLDDFF